MGKIGDYSAMLWLAIATLWLKAFKSYAVLPVIGIAVCMLVRNDGATSSQKPSVAAGEYELNVTESFNIRGFNTFKYDGQIYQNATKEGRNIAIEHEVNCSFAASKLRKLDGTNASINLVVGQKVLWRGIQAEVTHLKPITYDCDGADRDIVISVKRIVRPDSNGRYEGLYAVASPASSPRA